VRAAASQGEAGRKRFAGRAGERRTYHCGARGCYGGDAGRKREPRGPMGAARRSRAGGLSPEREGESAARRGGEDLRVEDEVVGGGKRASVDRSSSMCWSIGSEGCVRACVVAVLPCR
jgi:hypothetical protein